VSHVTNVILCIDGYEDDELVRERINPWLAEHGEARPFAPVSGWDDDEPTAYTAGSKVMESNVFLGAFNHFPLDDFLAFLETLPWRERECVQCFVQDQHERRFTDALADVRDVRGDDTDG